MDTDIEVRFYWRKRPRGVKDAKKDAKGWYVALSYFSPNDVPLYYDSVVIIKRIALQPKYVGSWFTQRFEDSDQVDIQYDGTTLVCAGKEDYGEAQHIYNQFLQDALAGREISVQKL